MKLCVHGTTEKLCESFVSFLCYVVFCKLHECDRTVKLRLCSRTVKICERGRSANICEYGRIVNLCDVPYNFYVIYFSVDIKTGINIPDLFYQPMHSIK